MEGNNIGAYLKNQRQLEGYSLRDLAGMAGVSHGHLREVENGAKSPTLHWLMKVLRALSLDRDDFFKKAAFFSTNIQPAEMGKLRRIPVISWVRAGNWDAVEDPFHPGHAEEWIESDVKGDNVFALWVTGDSMIPEFQERDIVVVSPHREPKSGDYVIFKNEDDGEATFKQLKQYGGTYVLHPLNPKYADIELKKNVKYRIVGVVVRKVKNY